MLISANFSNINLNNQNNKKGKEINFSAIYALKMPAKYEIRSRGLAGIVIKNNDAEFDDLSAKFYNFIKKKLRESI